MKTLDAQDVALSTVIALTDEHGKAIDEGTIDVYLDLNADAPTIRVAQWDTPTPLADTPAARRFQITVKEV